MPQLVLITPAIQRVDEIFKTLDSLTKALPVAAVRLRLAAGFDGPSLVSGLAEVVQNRDIALLVEDDVDFALAAKADGVHLNNYVKVAEARAKLGDEASIGAHCYASRHAAMEAGEMGADYVSFSPASAPEVVELIGWWTEATVLPSVAEGVTDELTARRIAEAGADFISFETDKADAEALIWLANQTR